MYFLAVALVVAITPVACSSDNDPFVTPKATGGSASKDAGTFKDSGASSGGTNSVDGGGVDAAD